jgi:hypothetical protein
MATDRRMKTASVSAPNVCVYCRERGADTADHIPPRCLFSKPRPSDLITVPSCKRCNKSFERDDTYFRDCLVLDQRTGGHPDAQAIQKSVFRGLGRTRAQGYARFFLSKIESVAVRSPSALHLGRRPGFDVDLTRLSRVAARIIQGLYFHNQGAPLPTGWEASAYFQEGFAHLPLWELEDMAKTVIRPTLSNPAREVGRRVLRYWTAHASDQPHASSWVLEFYGGVQCLGATLPVRIR